MIEIRIGAAVVSGNSEIGRIEQAILDHNTGEVTHLVIRHGGAFQARHIVMPLDWITAADAERVVIDHGEGELESLPNFEMRHYVSLDKLDEEHWEHPRARIRPADWIDYLVPLVANAFGDPLHTPGVVVTDQLLSATENAIPRGMAVESSDGHKVGEVLELLLGEPEMRVSGLIISHGLVPGQSARLPGDWIGTVQHDRILLNRTREQVTGWLSETTEER